MKKIKSVSEIQEVYGFHDRFDAWMVQSNLKTIFEQGEDAKKIVATVRANGYNKVADAVENEVATAEDKTQIPSPGRKLTMEEAKQEVYAKFGGTLKKLAEND